ncbi:multidrug ABC transporter permease [Clostridia bacterium]|nr:multidrug ABC transporter permease [Clostridia bacterium]
MPKIKKSDDRKRSQKVSFFRVFKEGVSIVFTAAPALYVFTLIISIVHGVSQGWVALFSQRLYESIADMMGTQTDSGVNAVIFALAILAIFTLLRELLNGLDNYLGNVKYYLFNAETTSRINKKLSKLEPVCFENTDTHDQINKAGSGANCVILVMMSGVMLLTFYLPYYIFMGVYLSTMNPLFILTILCVFLPTLAGQLIRAKVSSAFEDAAAPVRRVNGYYESLLTSKEYFKESRILGAFKFFIKRFNGSLKELTHEEWVAKKRVNLIEILIGLFTAAGWAGILIMLVNSLLAKEITIGAFAAIFGSVQSMFMLTQEVFFSVGMIARDYGTAGNYIRFLNLPERGGVSAEPDNTAGIVINNASFSYPKSENGTSEYTAVDCVSLEIKQGETIAIVGENGAGKSTLVRLITGHYKPTEGTVTTRGIDTSKTDRKSLFGGVSGVFQKYQRYSLTLKENVQISEIDKDEAIESTLTNTGVDYQNAETFPSGIDTMLSREFDGVDLSGGQWQRVAIARGLYRTHDLIVLDEPTAAIDPIEESRIYKLFTELSKDKTAVIVTHRLGSAKIADRIIVMDHGKIAETGSHAALLANSSKYADMWNAQAQWYE